MKISIAIPSYTDNDLIGANHLTKLLDSIILQDYKDVEVVISDHSTNNYIEDLCKSSVLNIKYLKYDKDRGFWGSNINNAIKNCSGDLIKLMQQDDIFASKDVLSKIIKEYEIKKFDWAICGGVHTIDYKSFYHKIIPEYTNDLYKGNNKLGGVSSIVIKNTIHKLYFDDFLNWMGDCDYYIRAFNCFGFPKIFEDSLIVYKQWSGQFTNTLSEQDKNKEVELIYKKYSNREVIDNYEAN